MDGFAPLLHHLHERADNARGGSWYRRAGLRMVRHLETQTDPAGRVLFPRMLRIVLCATSEDLLRLILRFGFVLTDCSSLLNKSSHIKEASDLI